MKFPTGYLQLTIRAARNQALTPSEMERLQQEALGRWEHGDQGDCPEHGPYATETCPRCPQEEERV